MSLLDGKSQRRQLKTEHEKRMDYVWNIDPHIEDYEDNNVSQS